MRRSGPDGVSTCTPTASIVMRGGSAISTLFMLLSSHDDGCPSSPCCSVLHVDLVGGHGELVSRVEANLCLGLRWVSLMRAAVMSSVSSRCCNLACRVLMPLAFQAIKSVDLDAVIVGVEGAPKKSGKKPSQHRDGILQLAYFEVHEGF